MESSTTSSMGNDSQDQHLASQVMKYNLTTWKGATDTGIAYLSPNEENGAPNKRDNTPVEINIEPFTKGHYDILPLLQHYKTSPPGTVTFASTKAAKEEDLPVEDDMAWFMLGAFDNNPMIITHGASPPPGLAKPRSPSPRLRARDRMAKRRLLLWRNIFDGYRNGSLWTKNSKFRIEELWVNPDLYVKYMIWSRGGCQFKLDMAGMVPGKSCTVAECVTKHASYLHDLERILPRLFRSIDNGFVTSVHIMGKKDSSQWDGTPDMGITLPAVEWENCFGSGFVERHPGWMMGRYFRLRRGNENVFWVEQIAGEEGGVGTVGYEGYGESEWDEEWSKPQVRQEVWWEEC
ncbi:hypothetical protein EJ08DRAFT_678616 [Tothia fuscella]|uniref:Uncharacterized protein n=1 Tax=Tothia fuscella TaxID=1048955 RepID=A0A9P4NTD5_9PEZI|nr:hypothetical protein EJ08DRAFT_678616 [Tothia fuscella]